MITKKTVLILGAGASNPYGFPLGQALMKEICGIQPGTNTSNLIVEAGYEPSLLRDFVSVLARYGNSSVDWFLEERREFTDIGRAAIAATLIPYEFSQRLFPGPDQHWYRLLVNTLDMPRGEFTQNRLSIVTFNYDRSLEHYLFEVLRNRYRDDDKAVAAIVSLPIIHVHGKLGELAPIVPKGRHYSSHLSAEAIRSAAERIKVVGEANDDDEAFAAARKVLGEAERVAFLGFGYHPVSVRRLGLFNDRWDDQRRKLVRVGGTSVGIIEREWGRIQDKVLNGAYGSPRRFAKDVFSYLNEFEPLDA